MDYQHITVSRQDHIGYVTFNRPDKANALNHAHLTEIEAATLAFREEADIRVVIFGGVGNHFSSGADLTDPGDVYKVPLVQRRRRLRMGERTIEAILDMDQITIAAWQGAAMGGGACIATACDFRIGARGCFMQYPEIDIGLNLMWKSLPLLINLVGPARAKRLVVGGERLHNQTLLDWGILDQLVRPHDLSQAVAEMAAHYAAKPPIAAQMIKQSANQIANALNHAIMHMDTDQNLLSASTQDRERAMEAYLNQTPPIFTGN
jgi:enoyl-CoA hydratase/carnithine racemase